MAKGDEYKGLLEAASKVVKDATQITYNIPNGHGNAWNYAKRYFQFKAFQSEA